MNIYMMSLDDLRHMLMGLGHAGVHEIVTDSDGVVIAERDHHYLGCRRCEIEDVIRQRQSVLISGDSHRGPDNLAGETTSRVGDCGKTGTNRPPLPVPLS